MSRLAKIGIIKGKLKQKQAKFTDDKLECAKGKSEELQGRIEKHTSEIREAIKKTVKQAKNNQH